MRLLAAIMLLCAAGASATAVNPISHNDVLRDNEKLIKRSTPDDEEDPYFILINEADKAINEGDYVTAISRIKDAMRVDPSNPANAMLLSNLGMVYGYLDQDSLALRAYDQALAIAPAMTTVMGNRALLKIKMGRDKEAFDEFAAVISRDSANVVARYYHGIMSLYGGDLPTAKADFAVITDAQPDSYYTSAAMASLYTLTGDDAKAIPYYKKLIKDDPATPEYYSGLACCYIATSQLAEASATIAEGLEKCGEDPDLYYSRAWLNKESYLIDAAKADAKRAIDLGASPAKVKSLFK